MTGTTGPERYAWLDDDRDPEVVAWRRQQQHRYDTYLATDPAGLQEWVNRMDRLTAFGFDQAPVWRGDVAFTLRREPHLDHEILVAIHREQESVLVDPHTLDSAGAITLDRWNPDHHGTRLSYQLSCGGSETATLHVIDVGTGAPLTTPLPGCRYSSVSWIGDAVAVARPTSRGTQLNILPLTNAAHTDIPSKEQAPTLVSLPTTQTLADLESITDPDATWLALTGIDIDGRGGVWITELPVHITDGQAHPSWREILRGNGWTDLTTTPDGRLLLLTTVDAPNGRLLLAEPRIGVCHEILAQHPTWTIDGLAATNRGITVLRTDQGRHRLHELTPDGATRELPLPVQSAGSVSAISARPDLDEVWLTCSDVTTPPTTYRRATGPWIRVSGHATHDDHSIVVRHDSCRSADGTVIDLQIVEPRGPDRPRPTVLHAYGAFGAVITSTFHPPALAWAEAGGRFVIAAVRGGGDHGEQWHRSAVRHTKHRSVDDLLAAAVHLATDGRTAGRLGLQGESAGGLLAAAALVRQPALFGAVVCVAPLTDMVRYEQLGPGMDWTDEFGTAADPLEHEALRALSPLHGVTDGVDYPAVLTMIADNDTRVPPAHGRALCAALQATTSSSQPILLRQETDAGHGWSARRRRVARHAEYLHFLAVHLAERPPAQRFSSAL